jgi:hypothetical protein
MHSEGARADILRALRLGLRKALFPPVHELLLAVRARGHLSVPRIRCATSDPRALDVVLFVDRDAIRRRIEDIVHYEEVQLRAVDVQLIGPEDLNRMHR